MSSGLPAVTAEAAEREGRLGAEIVGHIEAAAHGEIGAHTLACDRAELERLPRLDC